MLQDKELPGSFAQIMFSCSLDVPANYKTDQAEFDPASSFLCCIVCQIPVTAQCGCVPRLCVGCLIPVALRWTIVSLCSCDRWHRLLLRQFGPRRSRELKRGMIQGAPSSDSIYFVQVPTDESPSHVARTKPITWSVYAVYHAVMVLPYAALTFKSAFAVFWTHHKPRFLGADKLCVNFDHLLVITHLGHRLTSSMTWQV